MKRLPLLALAVLCAACDGQKYGLPIALGSSSDEVRRILGGPTQVVKSAETRRLLREFGTDRTLLPTTDNVAEWYYSSGIVATFDRDRLFRIDLPAHATYQGFVVYSGAVVNGVKLKDRKETILTKLGRPEKIEADPLAEGTDPDVPVVWPRENRYYWRLRDYAVRVDFLNQAQSLDGMRTLPKDSVTSIVIHNR